MVITTDSKRVIISPMLMVWAKRWKGKIKEELNSGPKTAISPMTPNVNRAAEAKMAVVPARKARDGLVINGKMTASTIILPCQ